MSCPDLASGGRDLRSEPGCSPCETRVQGNGRAGGSEKQTCRSHRSASERCRWSPPRRRPAYLCRLAPRYLRWTRELAVAVPGKAREPMRAARLISYTPPPERLLGDRSEEHTSELQSH